MQRSQAEGDFGPEAFRAVRALVYMGSPSSANGGEDASESLGEET